MSQLVGPKPPLPDAVRQRLQTGAIDADLLRELLPPERFVLRGFMIVKAVDVTDQEVLSSLKRDLIDKDSIVSSSHFQGLQAKLRTFFRRPELRLGLAAVEGDRVLVLNDASRHEQACIFADSAHHTTAEFAGSLYERAVVQDRPVVVDDLTGVPGPDPDRGGADPQRGPELRLRPTALPGQGDRHAGAALRPTSAI